MSKELDKAISELKQELSDVKQQLHKLTSEYSELRSDTRNRINELSMRCAQVCSTVDMNSKCIKTINDKQQRSE